jgi:hypothetical protein
MGERAIKSSELCDDGFAVGSKVAITFVDSPEGAFSVAKSMVRPNQQNALGERRRIAGRRSVRELSRTLFDEGRIERGSRRYNGGPMRRGQAGLSVHRRPQFVV